MLGWPCGIEAIRVAFQKEGFVRRNARTCLLISGKNRILQLGFALGYVNWTDEQWADILWSDNT